MGEFVSLFSGSDGNATLVSHNGKAILVDCGVSVSMLKNSLQKINKNIGCISAVFVTHEHTDHIKGIFALAKKISVPFYATTATIDAMGMQERITPLHMPVSIGDFLVRPFKTSHDAADSVGYRITIASKSVAIATDTGIITDETEIGISGCELVMLECNHDISMLTHGRYPAFLKRRILSNLGHLSNDNCAATLSLLVQRGLKKVVLGHISDCNNTPLLAKATVTNALAAYGIKTGEGGDVQVELGGTAKVISF